MKFSGLLFLLATTLVLSSTDEVGSSQAKCIERERLALLSFKQGLVDPVNLLASWTSSNKDCCTWKGIRCDNFTNHVIKLHLRSNFTYYDDGSYDGNALGGEIGSSLVELRYLEHLDLSFNNFTKIPKFIGSLTRLRYLNLSENPIVGNIPSQLGNLTKLRVLDLSGYYSSMTTAHSFEWLSHLHYLRIFKLGLTNFTEAMDWFQSFKTAPALSTLELYECQFPLSESSSLSHINTSNSLTTLFVYDGTLESATVSRLLNLSNNLVDLDIWGCNIDGPLPNSFENLKSLRHVYLPWNEFVGELPKSLGNLCNLQELVLSFNRFNSILDDILESRNTCDKDPLEILDLSWNELQGPLPDISKMSSLRELYVYYNKLNGSLPESIGKLSNLEKLYVFGNSFTGVISEAHLGNLSKLQYLELSSNSLTLKLPFNWVAPFQLQYLGLGSCISGPQFPSWLQTQSKISFLNLSSSGITNAIPNWFFNLTSKLYYLDLSFNLINSTLPNLQLDSNNSPFVDLSSNQFHGSIPNFLFNASVLNLSNNSLTRFGPLFCTKLDGITSVLDLSNNLLFGSLPNCWFGLNNLEVLNLNNNTLSGVIPSSMASLYKIESLCLRHNNLSGNLPSFLKNCTQLKLLDVGENNLEGTIPTWIGERLTTLVILLLKANKFHGMIPSNLCHLSSIKILDISHNSISGVIPSCIHNFTLMVEKSEELDRSVSVSYGYGIGNYLSESYISKALIMWKGKEYEYEEILDLLRVIDLSSNQLIGEIPKELTNLVELAQLNLSWNNLNGSIPKEIGNLSKLESLDLSHNNLYGKISMGLAKISFLQYLDLSYNHLSGKIPTSTQLQSFNASSYTENLGLCGPPLLATCPGDHETFRDHGSNLGHGQEWLDMSFFYNGIEIGFAVGFIGVFGTFILNSYHWRLDYFWCLNKMGDWLYVMFGIGSSRLRRCLWN